MAVTLLARSHQTAIWERTRHLLRLRSALREFYPAALQAFPELHAPDALVLLELAPDPERAQQLSLDQVRAALRAARRRQVEVKAVALLSTLTTPGLRQPALVEQAYASIVRSQVRLIGVLNQTIAQAAEVVELRFGQHPDVEIYRSQPGLGTVLGARVLAEFGDEKNRYRDARARRTTPDRARSPERRARRRSCWRLPLRCATLSTRRHAARLSCALSVALASPDSTARAPVEYEPSPARRRTETSTRTKGYPGTLHHLRYSHDSRSRHVVEDADLRGGSTRR